MKELIEILLVEDDEDGKELLLYFLNENAEYFKIHHVRSGRLCIDFLETATKMPHLLLLDTNLPGMSGYELLTYLKTREKYFDMPVIMLDTLGLESDRLRYNSLGAVAYLKKPDSFSGYENLYGEIRAILG